MNFLSMNTKIMILDNDKYLGHIIHYLVLYSFIILCSSCATTDLADSWKSENFDTLADTKILVVSKASINNVRKSYETAIANKLRRRNLDAVESHLQFPSLKWEKMSYEEIDRIKMFKATGIPGIIITAPLHTIETHSETKSQLTGDHAEYSSNKSSVSTSKTYVFQAHIYNLALEEDQLVCAFLADVTNPDSLDELQKTFTEIVANQFK